MAYNQHEWTNGEIITAEKLNNMEQGISDCGAREISASATATVENAAGEPSVDVTAAGSVSGIAFDFAFKGIKGEPGEKGDAGVTPLCQKIGTAIQVSYDNGESWQVLVSLDDIKGEKGDAGIAPKLQRTEAAIQVSFDNGESWQDLISLDDLKGEKGDAGAAAPTIAACNINILGSAITGALYLSDNSSVAISGTASAESGSD